MTAPGETLSQRLRRETQALHTQAERAGIMPALLRAQLPLATYAELLHQLQAVYAALEQGLAGPGAPPVPTVLHRAAALQADLHWLAAPPRGGALQPATQAYVARLHALAQDAPLLLAAHAYVRYLGDLAGGQVLRRLVAQAYGWAGPDGLRFYDFGPATGHPALGAALRAMLDALPAANADAVVAEAQSAFRRHVDLFEQLAGRPA